ncbi:PRC-barrel domain-containing protein [Loktanella sp. SALINAS62]|uniref:PRC-barrel domain-containing protein n=1 Tax=Loktanella sp. SALINAS62 TaxID=2706124 RepID=UPI001B8D99BA|nr:PRC-barrel domain-containing protein [Loktanella sp. SALINAS62]MBS1302585.1 PRC-barrel domain containing protein [Loktanella sp. SALINAS62]
MDHKTHTPMRVEDLNVTNVEGINVYGPDDHDIGDVSHMHGVGPTADVVVDVGGFLGIGAKRVALPVSQLNFMRDENGNIHATTRMTKDELKELPEHTD